MAGSTVCHDRTSSTYRLPWPLNADHGTVRINGKRVAWQDGELHIAGAPADVLIDLLIQQHKPH